ncbi:MAG TPA: FRG domain-containing protein [Pyrinomonadaceae bacterium]|nr:FRG domain-containing protein [Pyrinomonadaceae bacterium]
MSHVIQTQVNCASAKEFLESLSPLGPFFKDLGLGETWLFRGQGSDWPLVPSALRDDGKLAALTQRDIQDYDERLRAERDVLIDFFEVADRRGLILPDDSQELRSRLETLRSPRGDRFITYDSEGWGTSAHLLSLAALAQHYGVPTRLLDWTRRSFTAAFFAAEDALKNSLSGSLVVWAFYFPLFGKHDDVSRGTDRLRVVTAPSATNANLRAQQGAFTLLNPIYLEEREPPFMSMERMLEESETHVTDPDQYESEWLVINCRLRKFTVPASEALNVLHLLAKFDVLPSVIYPGYASIVNELKLRMAWK